MPSSQRAVWRNGGSNPAEKCNESRRCAKPPVVCNAAKALSRKNYDLKGKCEHERKQPAERLVSAAAAPSRLDVVCHADERAVDKAERFD